LLDLGAEAADQDRERALHRGRAWRVHPLQRVAINASTALAAGMS
jgi:hypothetical protein